MYETEQEPVLFNAQGSENLCKTLYSFIIYKILITESHIKWKLISPSQFASCSHFQWTYFGWVGGSLPASSFTPSILDGVEKPAEIQTISTG